MLLNIRIMIMARQPDVRQLLLGAIFWSDFRGINHGAWSDIRGVSVR